MSKIRPIMTACLLLALAGPSAAKVRAEDEPVIRVGSKSFTENVVLGEILTQLIRSKGIQAEHRKDLGGTPVLWNALRRGDIDAYVEYTGTLYQETFSGRNLANDKALAKLLRDEFHIQKSEPLGLNNTYALGMLHEKPGREGEQPMLGWLLFVLGLFQRRGGDCPLENPKIATAWKQKAFAHRGGSSRSGFPGGRGLAHFWCRAQRPIDGPRVAGNPDHF